MLALNTNNTNILCFFILETRPSPIETIAQEVSHYRGVRYITRLPPPIERLDNSIFIFPYVIGFFTDAYVFTLSSPSLYLSSIFAVCGFIIVMPIYRLFKSSVYFPGAALDVREGSSIPYPSSSLGSMSSIHIVPVEEHISSLSHDLDYHHL
ncbi:hypothetical protein IW261DRAFT_271185 [Armillaria novae-zelandiae]|uniref:Uncharacterized protein n=1 Tax=Armillaria novae-zelandiae TaxID=153914 RepID=A0AA39P5F2_9AGAR|nr:hypothetical protein IW261DRAFT_271185 [Armillaria novae-zelandiae]